MKFSLNSLFSLLTIGVAVSYDLAPEGSEMHDPDQCTAILVSAGAAADGVGSMTTHTNDCLVSCAQPTENKYRVKSTLDQRIKRRNESDPNNSRRTATSASPRSPPRTTPLEA